MAEHLSNDPAAWRLVAEYASVGDFAREYLKCGSDPVRRWALMQAECRRRCSRKIPAVLDACPDFEFATRLSTEQCTSDALAAFHSSLVAPGGYGLDMTSGLGIDSIALSRRARGVLAVDIDQEVSDVFARNVMRLGIGNIKVQCADSAAMLETSDEVFDWIFIDPARRGAGGRRLYSLADCSPDVCALLPVIKRHTRCLVVKASPMLDITDTCRRIDGVTDIYAVGTATECKELVVMARWGTDTVAGVRRHAVTVDQHGEWTDHIVDTSENPSIAGQLDDVRWVAEPSPALMKCDAGGWICSTYGLYQIASSTHLYVSYEHEPPVGFPGRIYMVEKVCGYGRSESRDIAPRWPRINVTTRNFPDSPEQVVRRLRIKEGGDGRLFAVRDSEGRPRLLITCWTRQA